MAFERNFTILELFVRTIVREYNHFVSWGEMLPMAEDVDQQMGDKLIKIMKGDSVSILKILLECSSLNQMEQEIVDKKQDEIL